MRICLVASTTLMLAACGGGGDSGDTPNVLAARVCEEQAKERVGGKLYQLDQVALAASMKDVPNGEKFLTAPMVIEPGLTSEAKQIIECTVRFTDGKPVPDVVGFGFTW